MDKITIYHNNRCGTSRKVLEMIKEKGIEPEVVLYLETPLDRAKLISLLKKLKIKAHDLLRKKEILYKDLKLDEPSTTEDQIIDAMIANPILIERPIVVSSLGARLCRPAEVVKEILPHV